MGFGRQIRFSCLLSLLGLSLAACANSPDAERWFSPDPKLQASPTPSASATPTPTPTPTLPETPPKLPANFPEEIPRYPNAEMVESELTSPAVGTVTRWKTNASGKAIAAFYKQEFEDKSWEVLSSETADDDTQKIAARQEDLKVNLSIPAQTADTSSETRFEISYLWENETTADSGATQTDIPSPIDLSAVDLSDIDSLSATSQTDIRNLAALGVVPATGNFEPNKAITRAEFARWLVAANNAIYANNPGKQIRLVSNPEKPAFKDVDSTNENFAYIQALAEAGLIPSPLSGNLSAALFQPDSPLTRENLVLWKVPLDIRQALPKATLDGVQKTWGFQDTAKIDDRALGALAADYQNGEQSNLRRAFGFTTLFQPKKSVTRSEATTVLASFGSEGESVTAEEALKLKP